MKVICQVRILGDLSKGQEQKTPVWSPKPIWMQWTGETFLALPRIGFQVTGVCTCDCVCYEKDKVKEKEDFGSMLLASERHWTS